jgi:hypothetical protein
MKCFKLYFDVVAVLDVVRGKGTLLILFAMGKLIVSTIVTFFIEQRSMHELCNTRNV